MTTRNVNGDESCGVCDDVGWVIFAGETRVGGVTYETWSAACRWCERGEQAFRANPKTLSHYDVDTIDGSFDAGRRIWPSEYAATPAGQADPHVALMLKMLGVSR